MRKSNKLLAALLSMLLIMTALSVPALAANDLPGATVTELKGADLERTIVGTTQDHPYFVAGGTYTMAKGVRFEATDTEPTAYDDYICDFVLTLRSPSGYVSTNDFLLIGMYGTYGNTGLTFGESVPYATDGSYQVLGQLMQMHMTYKEIREDVGVFECGIVDRNLPEDTEIDIQLMLYPPGSQYNTDAAGFITAEPTQVGDTITYAPISIAKIDAYVGSDGLGNLRFVSNVNYKGSRTVEYFGTWFLPEDLMATKPDAKVTLQSDGSIASGSDFKADLVEIPAKDLDRAITGVSYVKFAGIDTVYTVQETTSVEASKNWTSR